MRGRPQDTVTKRDREQKAKDRREAKALRREARAIKREERQAGDSSGPEVDWSNFVTELEVPAAETRP